MVEIIPCNHYERLIDKEKHVYLCIECWWEVGHSGHLAADKANEEASKRQKELKEKAKKQEDLTSK